MLGREPFAYVHKHLQDVDITDSIVGGVYTLAVREMFHAVTTSERI